MLLLYLQGPPSPHTLSFIFRFTVHHQRLILLIPLTGFPLVPPIFWNPFDLCFFSAAFSIFPHLHLASSCPFVLQVPYIPTESPKIYQPGISWSTPSLNEAYVPSVTSPIYLLDSLWHSKTVVQSFSTHLSFHQLIISLGIFRPLRPNIPKRNQQFHRPLIQTKKDEIRHPYNSVCFPGVARGRCGRKYSDRGM